MRKTRTIILILTKHMHLARMLRAVCIFAFIFGGSAGFAQSEQQIVFWADALRQNDLPEVAHLMLDKKSLSWPTIEFYRDDQKLPIEQRRTREQLTTLGKNLFSKIQQYEIRSQNYSEPNVLASTKVLSDIANSLRKQGGYVNYVLADSANRLALGHLCFFLVQNPERHLAVREGLDHIGVPTFEKLEIGQLLEGEAGITGARQKLEKVSVSQACNEVLSILGGDARVFAMGIEPDKLKTAYLLDHFNILHLVRRMMYTDLVGVVSLPSLITFVQKGGAYKDIHVDDISDFKKVMGESMGQFKCDWLGIKTLSTWYLLNLTNDFKDPSQAPMFTKIAVE